MIMAVSSKKSCPTTVMSQVQVDTGRSTELFSKAKEKYLKSQTTVDLLNEVIAMFEQAFSLDPSNRDALAYMNYAKRDLSGVLRIKKGLVGHSKAKRTSEHKVDILAAYETEDETTDDDDELYVDDEEAETPPWTPVPESTGEEEQATWDGSA